MLYRNLLAMEAEELLRSPSARRRGADGRLRQDHAGPADGRDQRRLCPASTCRPGRCCAATGRARCSARARTPGSTGTSAAPASMTKTEWIGVEGGIARSHGTCMTMGTASTMTAIAEAIGLTLPGASSIPAADASHMRMRAECGRRIVEMVWEDLTPASILTRASSRTRSPSRWRWAARPTPSSTSWRWRGAPALDIGLDDFDAREPEGAGDRQHPAERRHLPDGGLLLRRRPAGADAAGSRATSSSTRSPSPASTLGENIAGAKVFNDDVIRPLDNADLRRGRARGAARQPRARRLRHQAERLRAASCCGTPARRWSSTTIRR